MSKAMRMLQVRDFNGSINPHGYSKGETPMDGDLPVNYYGTIFDNENLVKIR